MHNDPDKLDSSIRISCLSCFALVSEDESFCPDCGAAIGAVATLDPVQTIRAEGYLLGKATDRKPKPIVLIGSWILFFPLFVGTLLLSVPLLFTSGGDGTSGFLFFIIGLSLAVLFAILLFKVTRNYFMPSKRQKEKNHEA